MKLVPVTSVNLDIYLRLIQSYEAEFSAITQKRPNAEGVFALDTQLGSYGDQEIIGYLVYTGDIPSGFAAIACSEGAQYEICEFYILPCFRRHKLGQRFAAAVWDIHRGDWCVKQIQGAEYATHFWRNAIASYLGTAPEEDVYQDAYWGQVTRQRFTNNSQ